MKTWRNLYCRAYGPGGMGLSRDKGPAPPSQAAIHIASVFTLSRQPRSERSPQHPITWSIQLTELDLTE